MATLTGKPSTIAPAVTSGTITLDPASLISEMSITDPYWSVSTNWSRVVFEYSDATGSESENPIFWSPTYTSTFMVSSTARQNTWQVNTIVIFDHDQGSYVITRATFPTPTEFDIIVAAPIVGTAYRYWRLQATDGYSSTSNFASSGYVGLEELKFKWGGVDQFLTSYTFTPISSITNLPYINDGLYNVPSRVCYGTTTFDVYVDLVSSQLVTDILIAPQEGSFPSCNNLFHIFNVQGSNDATTWTVMASFSLSSSDSGYGPAANEWQSGSFRTFNVQ